MTDLDEIIEVVPGRTVTAIRHVPQTLEVFATHFPLFPVLPGVLILDDLVQVARLALQGVARIGHPPVDRWELARAGRIRYRHFVQPGDSMEITVRVTGVVDGSATCQGTVRVDGRPVTIANELVLRPMIGAGAA
jgi:3-hydroxyacyl-[acyl-carrier-protein] dehydratase